MRFLTEEFFKIVNVEEIIIEFRKFRERFKFVEEGKERTDWQSDVVLMIAADSEVPHHAGNVGTASNCSAAYFAGIYRSVL